jgi:hypothetical protein
MLHTALRGRLKSVVAAAAPNSLQVSIPVAIDLSHILAFHGFGDTGVLSGLCVTPASWQQFAGSKLSLGG